MEYPLQKNNISFGTKTFLLSKLETTYLSSLTGSVQVIRKIIMITFL